MVHLSYVAYPNALELVRPSQLKTEAFHHFEETTQSVLADSLEIAALRRHLDASLAVFRPAWAALWRWTRARGIHAPEMGYPNGLAWALLLAGTPVEESPELWLEGLFRRLSVHDWRQPLMVSEGHFIPASQAPMQVFTLSFPHQNATENVRGPVRHYLETEVEAALEILWAIQRGETTWDDFFAPTSLPFGAGLQIQLRPSETDGPEDLKAWWTAHLPAFFDALETCGVESLRPASNWEVQGHALVLHLDLPAHAAELPGIPAALLQVREKFAASFPHSQLHLQWTD